MDDFVHSLFLDLHGFVRGEANGKNAIISGLNMFYNKLSFPDPS